MDEEIKIPAVTLQSGWLLDDSVAELSGTTLSEEATAEIAERLSEFQRAWDDRGPKLLRIVTQEFALKYRERDINAFLICGRLFSQSHPLLINAKYFLRSLREHPQPLESFTETVLHELLHILLQDCLVTWPTPAITKLANDNFEIAAHLHLMTLQRFAHERAGTGIGQLNAWYRSMGENYERAWALVQHPSNYEKLLAELRGEWFAHDPRELESLHPNL